MKVLPTSTSKPPNQTTKVPSTPKHPIESTVKDKDFGKADSNTSSRGASTNSRSTSKRLRKVPKSLVLVKPKRTTEMKTFQRSPAPPPTATIRVPAITKGAKKRPVEMKFVSNRIRREV